MITILKSLIPSGPYFQSMKNKPWHIIECQICDRANKRFGTRSRKINIS